MSSSLSPLAPALPGALPPPPPAWWWADPPHSTHSSAAGAADTAASLADPPQRGSGGCTMVFSPLRPDRTEPCAVWAPDDRGGITVDFTAMNPGAGLGVRS
eukprot:gene6964-60996_t